MTGDEAKKKLESFRPSIEKNLRSFFAKEKKQAKKIDPFIHKMVSAVAEQLLRGGKRLRPMLTIATYNALGGKDSKNIEQAALGSELFHTFLLIHDDVMDEDDLRHGGPALHKVFRNYHKQRKLAGESKHFGESIAIDVGDIVAALSYRVILESDFSCQKRVEAVQQMNRAMMYTGYGQAFDILVGVRGKASEQDLFRIHEYKTARYTIETPMALGAIFAGKNEKIMQQISSYAIPLGIAFQIQDDILGLFADEKKLGKPVGSDLREGKQTLLITNALKKASRSQKKLLQAIVGNQNLTLQDIKVAREIIKDTGSLRYSNDLAKKYALQAKKSIGKSSFKKSGKDFFQGIATYIIERDF